PISKSEQKIRHLSLKRKVVQYERALREKSEEVAKLLSDRNVAKAAETRQRMEKLEAECARLKRHLNESVPESEFLREKDQYMDIIANLTEENMQMRQIIGKYQNEKSEEILRDADNGLSDEALLNDLRNYALSQKADAQNYRRALDRLIKQRHSAPIPTKPKIRSASAAPVRRKIFNKKPLAKTQSEAIKESRSKSTDVLNQVRRRVSEQQMSAPELPKHEEMGKEFLLPTGHKGYAMYRHAIDSDDSEVDDEENHDNSHDYNGGLHHADYNESELSSGSTSDLPQELYDAKGRIYFVEKDGEGGILSGTTPEYMPDLPDGDTGTPTEESQDYGDDITLVNYKDELDGESTRRVEVRKVQEKREIVEIESDGPTEKGVIMESWFDNADITGYQ
uniref:PH domain-containing protein n=1 Tax=Bursaphelenchus xylophilus TaxID=6326 RepID=A0A1I7SHT9_BURXY